MKIKHILREFRLARGKTQAEMAEIFNVDRTTITKWESGDSNPRITQIPEIAKVLGCTIDELLNEGEPDADAPASA